MKQLDHHALSGYSPEALYWCGMIATDGNVCTQKRGTSPTIALGGTDLEHIAKFREFFKSDHKICVAEPVTNFGIGRPVALLRFTSVEVARVLIENGITPRKSLTLKVSPRLAASPDFWRGAIDGDGCITRNLHYCPKVYLVSGSSDFLGQYSDFCDSLPEVGRPKVYEVESKNPCHRAELYGARAKALLKVIYSDPVQSLERKHFRAMQILTQGSEAEKRGKIEDEVQVVLN